MLASLANLTFFYSYHSLLPALPLYALQVSGSESAVGVVMGAVMAASLSLRLFVGRYVDTYTKKLFLVSGSLAMVAVSLLFPIANSVALLVLFRVFQGFSIAAFVTAIQSLVADIVPAGRRGEAIGIYGVSTNLSLSLSPALGGMLLGLWGFGSVFYSAAASTFVCFLLSASIVSASRQPARKASAKVPFFSRQGVHPALLGICLCFSYGSISSFLPLYALQRGIDNVPLF